MFRRKQDFRSGIAVEAFRKKQGGDIVRHRPATIRYNKKASPVLGSRANFAERLKSIRKGEGKKAALGVKRNARMQTFRDAWEKR